MPAFEGFKIAVEDGQVGKRTARLTRTTKETDISVELCLEGAGQCRVSTGIGFADHMLTLMTFWAGFDLDLACKGDLEVDAHHSLEDIGLSLGQVLAEALGDKAGIARVASARVPMDEALADVVVDLSGRPYLVYADDLLPAVIAGEEKDVWREFFKSFAQRAGMEGQRPGPSYTVDTLTALREKAPEDEQTFILGSEAFFALPTWRRGLELPHLCHLAVVLRNGSDPQEIVDFAEKAWPGMERAGEGLLRFATGNSLHIVSMPVFEVSATDIRERWRQRRCLAMLVPPAAEEIMERGGTAYEQAWGRRADI